MSISSPPVPPRRPKVRTHFGDRFVNNFDWLRDIGDPEARAHVEAENAYTAEQTAHLRPLIEEIAAIANDRLVDHDLSMPELVHHDGESWRRSYWYYLRIAKGMPQPIFSRMPVNVGAVPDPWAAPEDEEVLIDCNAEAGEEDFFRLGTMRVSPDGRLLAWLADNSGEERYVLTITDLVSGALVDGPFNDVGPSLAWAGTRYLFYTRLNEKRRPSQVVRHRVGTESRADVVVHDETDEGFHASVRSSRDQNWLLIMINSPDASEVRRIRSDEPESSPLVVAARRPGLKYQVEVAGDRLLVLHNVDAPDYELAQAPLEATREEQWRPLVEHSPGRRLKRIDAYADFLVLSLRNEGQSTVWVLRRGPSGSVAEPVPIELPHEVGSVLVSPAPNYTDTQVRVMITTFVTPPTTYNYDLYSGRMRQVKAMAVEPAEGEVANSPTQYVQERIWATAPDGRRIPISVVKRRDTPEHAPTILYGYGAYELSVDPSYDLVRLAALDRGFVYAVAHVRGGGELGREWHEAGRTINKTHTFTDFVACAQHLVETGIADPERMAAEGSSAGGLLVGAVVNSDPELFRAVVADVPFVDALTTELDPSIPLTVKDWEEFGNPLEDPQIYELMKSYSPYENIREVRYPAILATAAVSDTRVSFAEPLKWLARLREVVGVDPERPRLARIDTYGGHAGDTGVPAMTDDAAFRMAWVMDQIAPELAWRGLSRSDAAQPEPLDSAREESR